jgi:hypothetical protein
MKLKAPLEQSDCPLGELQTLPSGDEATWYIYKELISMEDTVKIIHYLFPKGLVWQICRENKHPHQF